MIITGGGKLFQATIRGVVCFLFFVKVIEFWNYKNHETFILKVYRNYGWILFHVCITLAILLNIALNFSCFFLNVKLSFYDKAYYFVSSSYFTKQQYVKVTFKGIGLSILISVYIQILQFEMCIHARHFISHLFLKLFRLARKNLIIIQYSSSRFINIHAQIEGRTEDVQT